MKLKKKKEAVPLLLRRVKLISRGKGGSEFQPLRASPAVE
jgi:hypothetical protein